MVSYFPPQNFCLGALDGSEGGSLRCYRDAQINFQATWADVCEIQLAIAGHSAGSMELIPYPNPGDGSIRINWPSQRSFDLEVRDGLGRIVHREHLFRESDNVELPHLKAGVYNLLVTALDGTRASAKWIKQ